MLDFSKELLEDENLEVRSAAAEELPKLILTSKAQHEKLIRNLIVLGLEKGPDFIRSLMIPCIVSLSHVDQNSATSLLKTLTAIKDWRVRYLTCHSLDKVPPCDQRSPRASPPTSSKASSSRTSPSTCWTRPSKSASPPSTRCPGSSAWSTKTSSSST